MAKRDAVIKAQQILLSADPTLRLDGIWGPVTARAYARATAEQRARVDNALLTAGLTVDGINRYQARGGDQERYSDTTRYIDREAANQIVKEEAQRLGLSQHAEALQDFLRREARRVSLNGNILYDIRSRNGSSQGLMQMQPGAWIDAAKTDPTLGSYDPYNPRKNIAAGIAYAKRNIRAIERAGKPVTADTLYLAHNQGAGFFTRGIVTNVAGQSKEVQDLIRQYS